MSVTERCGASGGGKSATVAVARTASDVDVMMSGLVPFLLCPLFTVALCGAVNA